jgi:hypothetical protein
MTSSLPNLDVRSIVLSHSTTGRILVRITMLVIAAAALLMMPAASATAGSAGLHKMQGTDFSAAKKKKARRHRAEKVEYMRAVPSR